MLVYCYIIYHANTESNHIKTHANQYHSNRMRIMILHRDYIFSPN